MENPTIFENEFDKLSIKKKNWSKEMKERVSTPIPIPPSFGSRGTPDNSEYRIKWFFKNGFGISVVRGFGTYGAGEGLFEIAVLDKDGHLTYSTKITDDVIGNLTSKEVLKIGVRISKLKGD